MRGILILATAVSAVQPTLGQATSKGTVAVVVRGVGETADAAKKDAILNAIQQVVGLYVDAETMVKNDELVRDTVRTFANAEVRSAELVGDVKQDGRLVRVTMKVFVVPDALTQMLRSNKVAVKSIPGGQFAELFRQKDVVDALQKEIDGGNLDGLKGLLADYDPAKIWKAEIVGGSGKPEVERLADGAARVKAKVQVRPDMAEWRKFQSKLTNALASSDAKRARRQIKSQIGGLGYNGVYGNMKARWSRYDWWSDFGVNKGADAWMKSTLGKEAEGGDFLGVLNNVKTDRERTKMDLTVDFFRVPEGTVAELEERSKDWTEPRVEIRLIGQAKETIQATEVSLIEAIHFKGFATKLKPWSTNMSASGGLHIGLATPFVWMAGPEAGPPGVGVLCAVPDPFEVSLDVSRAELERVKGVVAAVISAKRP